MNKVPALGLALLCLATTVKGQSGQNVLDAASLVVDGGHQGLGGRDQAQAACLPKLGDGLVCLTQCIVDAAKLKQGVSLIVPTQSGQVRGWVE